MISNLFQLKNTHSRYTNIRFTSRRNYSTLSSSKVNILIPVLTLTDIQDKDYIISKREVLSKKGGIYSFINKVNGKQYIGSTKDIYLRLNEHLSNRK